MIRLSSWGMGALAFSISVSAFAQDAAPTQEGGTEASAGASATTSADSGGLADKKVRLGLRLGYALPMGDLYEGAKLGDGTSGQIPIWIDAGYMVMPSLMLGLYGQYGFVQTKNCDAGTTCSAHDVRFGVQGQYHLMPAATADPWLGLGFGYEVLSVSQTGGIISGDASLKGLEFLNLQGGADFQVADALAVGPFLSFSLGKYSSASFNGTSADIDKTAMHEWLTLGVKGTFGL